MPILTTYKYAYVYQNGRLLLEGEMQIIWRDGMNYISFYNSDKTKLIEVGRISDNGIAIIEPLEK